MLPKARNETEEGLVTGETLVREKTCRIQEAADFLVDSFKELNEEYQNFAATSTATNMRLQAKLAEFQAHTATLQTRNAELRYELEGYKSRLKELEHKVAVASLEKEAGGNQRAKNTKTNRDETITSDEAVLEEYIRRIEDDAASASSTVSLETFRKLHGVYSAIKGALQAKYAKVKKKKTFYKEKYKEQKRDKDAADKEDNPRDNDTAPFQEEREGLRTDKQDIQKIFINRSKSHRPVDQKESPRVEDTANQKGSSRDEDTTPFGKESKILKNYLKELRPRDADAAPSQKSSETPQTELLERVPVATEEIKTEDTDKDKANNAEKGDSDPTENEESSSLTIKILKKFCKLPRHDGEDRKLEFCAHWQRSASNEGTTDAETTKKRDSIPFDWGKNFCELQKYKKYIGTFDVPPTQALGKFVAFVRAEYEKFSDGQDALIGLEEIQKLDSIHFHWKARNRRKRSAHRASPLPKEDAGRVTKKARVVSPIAKDRP